jgi:hypothetical protein
VKFFDGLFHGYVRWSRPVLAPTSSIQTLATFKIADGLPGALPA